MHRLMHGGVPPASTPQSSQTTGKPYFNQMTAALLYMIDNLAG